MASRNYASIMGNLTADPELKHTNSGKEVLELTVAVNFGTGDNKRVDFIDVRVWGNWAKYLVESGVKKGSLVNIDGYLTQDRWVDKTSNDNRSRLWITARTIFHVEQKFAPKDEAANGHAQPPVPDAELQPAGASEDTPF